MFQTIQGSLFSFLFITTQGIHITYLDGATQHSDESQLPPNPLAAVAPAVPAKGAAPAVPAAVPGGLTGDPRIDAMFGDTKLVDGILNIATQLGVGDRQRKNVNNGFGGGTQGNNAASASSTSNGLSAGAASSTAAAAPLDNGFGYGTQGDVATPAPLTRADKDEINAAAAAVAAADNAEKVGTIGYGAESDKSAKERLDSTKSDTFAANHAKEESGGVMKSVADIFGGFFNGKDQETKDAAAAAAQEAQEAQEAIKTRKEQEGPPTPPPQKSVQPGESQTPGAPQSLRDWERQYEINARKEMDQWNYDHKVGVSDEQYEREHAGKFRPPKIGEIPTEAPQIEPEEVPELMKPGAEKWLPDATSRETVTSPLKAEEKAYNQPKSASSKPYNQGLPVVEGNPTLADVLSPVLDVFDKVLSGAQAARSKVGRAGVDAR